MKNPMRRCRPNMRVLSLALGIAALVALAPRPAHAQDDVDGSALIFGGVLLGMFGADVVFVGYDLVQAVQEERASRGMAIAEVALGTPQFMFGSLALLGMRRDDNMIIPAVWVSTVGVLAVHGMVTLATEPTQPEPPRPKPPDPDPNTEPDPNWVHPRMSFAPTMLSDGVRSAVIPGVMAVGTF
jgi:hypothetical protein